MANDAIDVRDVVNDERAKLLLVEGSTFIMTEEKLIRLRDVLLERFPIQYVSPSTVTNTLWGIDEVDARTTFLENTRRQRHSRTSRAKHIVPAGYELIASKTPDPRSGYDGFGHYEYYEDRHHNQGYRIITQDGRTSSFHRLGRVDDPQSRVGRVWARFPDKQVTKKELADIFTQDYQRLKAYTDILVRTQNIEEFVVTTTKKGQYRFVAYRKKGLSRPTLVESNEAGVGNKHGPSQGLASPAPSSQSGGVA